MCLWHRSLKCGNTNVKARQQPLSLLGRGFQQWKHLVRPAWICQHGQCEASKSSCCTVQPIGLHNDRPQILHPAFTLPLLANTCVISYKMLPAMCCATPRDTVCTTGKTLPIWRTTCAHWCTSPLSAQNWDGPAVAGQCKASWPCQPCRTCRDAQLFAIVPNPTHWHNTQGLL